MHEGRIVHYCGWEECEWMMKQEIQLMSAPVINPKAEATYKQLKEYNQVSLLLLMNILR